MPEGVTQETFVADGVVCDWIIPDTVTDNRILVYLHGGGFVFAQSAPHMELGGYLALAMQAKVLMVDYRVAPQHPFPVPLDDCVTAYRWLLKQGTKSNCITIAGDSAGGTLTLATLMKLRDAGDPLPVAAACMSPVIDFVLRDTEAQDLVLPARALKKYRSAYLADNDPKNPLISTIYGNWEGLPPLLIHAGGDEVLKDDAIQIEKITKDIDTEVTVKIYPGMFHVWQIYPNLPETKDSLDLIAKFLVSHLELKI